LRLWKGCDVAASTQDLETRSDNELKEEPETPGSFNGKSKIKGAKTSHETATIEPGATVNKKGAPTEKRANRLGAKKKSMFISSSKLPIFMPLRKISDHR